MKKVSLLIFVSLILLLAFASCQFFGGGHEHEWSDATCSTPKTCLGCGETEGEALGHDWTAATCTSPATCKICEATEGAALGHQWRDATCTASKTCLVCNETEGAPLGHKNDIVLPAEAATCTKTGLTEGVKCSACQTITTPQETVPKTGHTEETVPGKAASCTDTGLSDGKKCTVCGTVTVEQEILPMVAHSEETLPAKAPTCTEDGLKEGKKCTVCGTVTVVQEKVPATGHKNTTKYDKEEPTCTEDGLSAGEYCNDCQTWLTEREVLEAPGHEERATPIVTRNEPSCTAEGSIITEYKCKFCGETVRSTSEPIDKIPHNWGEYTYNEDAKCGVDGTKTATCTYGCGTPNTITAEGTALVHTAPDGVVCGDEWTCKYCNEYTEVLAHDYADATCQVLATCKNCGETTGELAPCVPGAAVKENEVAPQCEVAGSYDLVTYCTVCGTECSRETQTVDPTGHDMAPATCDAPSTCKNGCGKTEGEAVANHTPVATLFDGVLTYKCTTCDDSFTTEQLITYVGNDKADLFFTKNGDPTVSIVDGAYSITAGEARSQYMIYGPSNDKNHPNTMTGWNNANNSFGVFSFRIQLGTITENVRFIVMSSRNNPNWDANKLPDAGDGWSGNSLDLLSVAPNGDGTFEIAGRNITSNTFATVSGDEWVDVKMFMQINTEGLFTVSYYINGEFMNTYTRDLLDPATTQTIKNLDINNFYICGWTAPGTGFAIDDMYFGYAKNQEWLFDEHEHRWADADCESPKHCIACGLTEGSALGHIEATRDENVVAPDCVNTGSHDVVTYCTVCNKELGRETVVDAALGHTPGEVVIENNVDPTCVLDGKYDEVQYCTVCTKEANRKTVTVPATGHTEVAVPGKDATCTEPGLTEGKVCSVCGDTVLAQEVIPAKGHTEEVVPGKDATCTATGLTEGKVCSVCEETLVAQVEIPVVAHTYDNDEDADCNVCGYTRDVACQHENTTTLDAVEATCTATGLTEGKKCDDCGETITAQEVVPALGHLNDITLDAVAATCTATGLTEGVKCSRCEETTTAQVEVPALGHLNDVTIPAVDATCTATGLTAGVKCSRCGETTTAQTEVAALGHSFNNYVKDNNATCLADGTKTSKCDRCDVTDSITDEGTKLDHTPGEAVKENIVAPTCSAKGSHDEVVKCSACGTELSRTTVEDATLAHDFGVATCISAKACKVCGVTEGEPDAHAHNIQATYDGDKLFYACQRCDYRFDVDVFDYSDGTNYNGMHANASQNNTVYTTNGSNYPVIKDGYLEFLRTDSEAGVQKQLQMWLPSANGGTNKFSGFSAASNSIGYLAFKVDAKTDVNFEMKLVDNRVDTLDGTNIRWGDQWAITDPVFRVLPAENGVAKLVGFNSTLLASATVDENGFTGWYDVAIQIVLDADTDKVIAYYYINGEYVGTSSRELTTHTNAIQGVYINFNSKAKGCGYRIDNLTFGYTAHKHDFEPTFENGVLSYNCACGTDFVVSSEVREWNGDGNDSAFQHGPNGKWNTVYNEDGTWGFMFQPKEDTDWGNYNAPGGQMQPWLPSSNRDANTLTGFSTENNAVGVISFDVKTSMTKVDGAGSTVTVGVGKPRNASDWNDGGSWTDDFFNILAIMDNGADYTVKGGVNSGLLLATITKTDNGWSEWFNVMMVIDLDTDGTMTTYYYINGAFVASESRNLGVAAADDRYLNPQKIEAFQISGWTYAAETGMMFDNMYFGYTANGHNTLDGQRHVLTETTCGEKSTCSCGWTGYTVAHTFATDCAPACSVCGLANEHATTHANLTASYDGTNVTYACADCNFGYTVNGDNLHTSADFTIVDSDSSHTYTPVDGGYTVLNNGTANGQYQIWVPAMSESAELAGFTNANAATGFLSFKINVKDHHNTGLEFKINANRGTGDWGGPTNNGWSESSVRIFQIKPTAEGATTVGLSGYNGADLGSVAITGTDGWTGWLDVVVKIQLNKDNTITVNYYVNGTLIKTIHDNFVIWTHEINSLYISGRTNAGQGYELKDIYFGYTLAGATELAPAEEPFYTAVIEKDTVTNEVLTAIVDSKFKQCDQCTTVNAQGGTPVYVVADKNGEDVQALYVSRTYAWDGTEAEQFTEFRFDVVGKATSITFDYKAKGTVETNDRYEFTDLEGNKFYADAYVQIKTPDTHPGAGDNYPELSGTDLTLDGEWHTMTYTFAEPTDIINILFNLYHFQGELLVANLNVTFEA